MTAPLAPLHDYVLIRQKDRPKIAGSLLLPDNAQRKPREGTVLAVGPGKRLDDGSRVPMSVKPGDVVLFKKNADLTKIDLGDGELLMMRDYDVLGVW